jgi:dimethylargininase
VRALVRRPSTRLAEGIVTHLERRPVDAALALRQWDAYVAALAGAGWDVLELPPADDCPDGVFVEDVVVAYDGVAVLTRPGVEARRAELAGVHDAVASLGYRVERIEASGTLDGGDVLRAGATVYVGEGARTNAEGIRQLRGMLQPHGATVVAAPVSRVLHLKSAVTALPDGSIIGFGPSIDDPAVFPGLVEAPEEAGAHVVQLGAGKLLVAAGCPRSVELLEGLGYDPVVVDIGEFEKLEGCVTCLSVLLER